MPRNRNTPEQQPTQPAEQKEEPAVCPQCQAEKSIAVAMSLVKRVFKCNKCGYTKTVVEKDELGNEDK